MTQMKTTQSYADQYLQRHSAPQSWDDDASPYGDWYLDRLSQDDAGQTVTGDWDTDEPVAAAAQEDFDTASRFAPQTENGAAPEADAPPPPGSERSELADAPPMPLHPRAAPVQLSARARSQMNANQRELALIEGNMLAASDTDVKAVYVTSSFQGEGKTTSALSAAYGLAAVNQARVLLIDGNRMRPRLHGFFGGPVQPGWSDALTGEASLEDILHESDVPGLHFMAAGQPYDAIPEMRAETARQIGLLKTHYDFVIMDGASVLASSDATRLSPQFDGVMMVIACERTKWEVVQSAIEKIEGSGAKVLGAALNQRRYYIPGRVYKWLSR